MQKLFQKFFVLTILSGLIMPALLLSNSHPAQASSNREPVAVQFDDDQLNDRREPQRPRPSPGPKDEGDGD